MHAIVTCADAEPAEGEDGEEQGEGDGPDGEGQAEGADGEGDEPAANEDEDAGAGEAEPGCEEEDEGDDLKLAWDNLELARIIYERLGPEQHRSKLAGVHVSLGDIKARVTGWAGQK